MKNFQGQNKKLILHIGQSKTGTTSFQGALHRNSDALSQTNLAYPITGLQFSSHALLAMHYLGSKIDNMLVENLKAEIRNTTATHVLISCEVLEALSATQAKMLTQDFEEFELHLLCSLRGRLGWATSMFAENAKKAMFTDSFQDLIYCHNSNVPRWRRAVSQLRLSRRSMHIANHFHNLLQDSQTLGQWCQLLPADRISLVKVSDSAIWGVLRAKFGLSIDEEIIYDGQFLNRSPTVLAVEFARRFYSSTGKQDLPYPLATRFLSRMDREIRDLRVEGNANCYFSSLEEASEFLDRYAKEDDWLQRNFGISRCDKNKLSELRFLNKTEIDEHFRSLEKDIRDWFSEADIK